ncbi:MAG: hypothetical protein JG761_438 [Proteiniphilum sp.]|jgi:hypothetical protein|nr:hypothetical protein [Proteiniphilum sp.]
MHHRNRYSLLLLITIIALSLPAEATIPDSVIWVPRVVGIPPSDAYIGLSLLVDGEIRHYNYGEQAEPGSFYLSSRDKRNTWIKVNIPKEIPFANTRSPLCCEYIRLIAAPEIGTYAIRTSSELNGLKRSLPESIC